MRILYFVQGYYPAIGGTERLVQKISERLVQNYGDEVIVYTTNAYNCEIFNSRRGELMSPGEEIINQVVVRRFPVFNKLAVPLNIAQNIAWRLHLPGNSYLRTLYSGPILPSIFGAISGTEFDVVAASSFPLLHMHYAGLASRLKRRPIVLQGGLHPEDRWGFDRRNIYGAIRRCDAYVAYTTYEKDYLVERGIDADKIHVVGVGTEPGLFAAATGARFKTRHNLDGEPIVAFVGQQGGHKGIDTLLKAMPLVWRRIPEARLIIAGARTNYSSVIDGMISALDAVDQHKVITVSRFDDRDKAEILAACDVFASPSGYESFGITYLEAWSAGKPVIGCRSGAIPSVIADGKTGILVEYKAHRELASVLIELIEDSTLRRRLGAAGRKRVSATYTWDKIASRFRSVYQKVV